MRLLRPGKTILVVVALSAVIALFAGLALWAAPFRPNSYTFKGLGVENPLAVPDFQLQDQDLRPVRLSDFRGKVVLLYFGFTNCPRECPMTMANWRFVADRLGEEAGQARFVMVTVDPKRDTPDRLKAYLRQFHPAIIGLTGSPEQIEDVTLSFQAFFRKVRIVSPTDYLVNHTTLTHVIDPMGRLVLAFTPEMPAKEILADVRQLLRLVRSGDDTAVAARRPLLHRLRSLIMRSLISSGHDHHHHHHHPEANPSNQVK